MQIKNIWWHSKKSRITNVEQRGKSKSFSKFSRKFSIFFLIIWTPGKYFLPHPTWGASFIKGVTFLPLIILGGAGPPWPPPLSRAPRHSELKKNYRAETSRRTAKKYFAKLIWRTGTSYLTHRNLVFKSQL